MAAKMSSNWLFLWGYTLYFYGLTRAITVDYKHWMCPFQQNRNEHMNNYNILSMGIPGC
jgi:hypothetical protein